MRRFYSSLIQILALGVLLPACSPFTSKKPPIILVLIESFSEENYLCSDLKLLEGLDALSKECENFVRFTHSFAPSPLTQASLATLMTGSDIRVHGVSDNGQKAIAAQFKTLAESAMKQGMRTSLISGGAPLMQKFGITQGFEYFNDGFDQGRPQYFRPVSETIQRGIKWIDDDVGDRSFFMTLYIPDLLYREQVTINDIDDERPKSRSSQLLEIYESLNGLIAELKKRKRWDNSHLIIVGLSGENLHFGSSGSISSDKLHVPLQIKLGQKVKSNLGATVGEIISFARLGKWIQTLIEHKPSQGTLDFTPLKEENFITQQSNWKKWLRLANWPDLGLRTKQFLFSFTPDLNIYDSYAADKKEIEEPLEVDVFKLYQKFGISDKMKSDFEKSCYYEIARDSSKTASNSQCGSAEQNMADLDSLAQIVRWTEEIRDADNPNEYLSQILQQPVRDKSEIVTGWLAYHALFQKKWTSLFELGKLTKNKSWMLVALTNLRENPTFETDKCLKYFVGENNKISDFYRHCQDSELRKVVEGIKNLKSKARPSESFWSQLASIKSYRRAKDLNLDMHFINDIDQPFDFSPKMAELYFFLPDNSDYQYLINTNEG